MRSRILWLILSFLMALSLVLASCTTTTEEEEEEEEIVVEEEEEEEEEEGPPVTGDWWDKFGEPEYGGMLTYRVNRLELDLDPYSDWGGQFDYYGEHLWHWDWTLDRGIWDFSTLFSPDEYWTGHLAESWEMPDVQTVIIHIRPGVYWHDKPPLNGREFTAQDVQHHYDRLLGKGSYTQPSPMYAGRLPLWKEITATDKYTVVFEFSYPSAQGFLSIVELAGQTWVEAPELVTYKDGFIDWRNAIGTGPWILTDFVSGSSTTYSRNPNYWGYDERHPQNQLPYADTLKQLCIPDIATSLAALRTGKVDMVIDLSWEQALSLKRTNPEMQQVNVNAGGPGPMVRVDKEPFTDINVRKALNMAIDREIIAETHYGGTVEGIPCGVVTPAHKGYDYHWDEWPQELKDEYSYNPERARELLTEAGFPNGFKTTLVAGSTSDLDLAQIVQAQFMEIGVDMDIKVMDAVAFQAHTRGKQVEQIMWSGWSCGRTFNPQMNIAAWTSKDMANYTCVQDPAYDAIYEEFLTCPDPIEAKRLVNEALKYSLEKHWAVVICPTYTYNVWQSYVKGYSGEKLGQGAVGWLWARLWIDQDLKESMGR